MKNKSVEEIVQLLINGEIVSVPDAETRLRVQIRLREIKRNCTEVLSQLKESI